MRLISARSVVRAHLGPPRRKREAAGKRNLRTDEGFPWEDMEGLDGCSKKGTREDIEKGIEEKQIR